jgi:hypothetical protein
MNESGFTGKCKRLVGGTWIRLKSQSQTGLPDWMVLKNLKVAFVEMKAPGELARPAQIVKGRNLSKKSGWPFMVVNSEDAANELKRYFEA